MDKAVFDKGLVLPDKLICLSKTRVSNSRGSPWVMLMPSPRGHDKIANAPSPGLTTWANAPRLPGGMGTTGIDSCITRCFLSASVAEFNFSPNIMQIGYTSPIGTFRFYKCYRFQKFCLVRVIKNQFYSSSHVFLWKPWINKLVTLCCHDHFQFEFPPFRKFLFNWPKNFQGKLAFRKSRRFDFSQFSSLWMLLWVFIPTSCSHRFSLGFP